MRSVTGWKSTAKGGVTARSTIRMPHPSTLSSLVERLVEAGFANRRDDPRDRRSVLVALAPAGNQMLDQFNELGADALRSLLEQLDDKEIVTVNKAIELLVAAARRLSEDPR